MKFCALRDEWHWGTEEFKLADLGYRDSFVLEGWLASNTIGDIMDTYMDRVTGENVYEHYGRQFPLCIRKLSVTGRMPLQVHPDDGTAEQRYDFLGKEKFWYVQKAGKGAKILLGFRNDSDAAELFTRCEDGSVEEMMNIVAPHAGQCLFIPSGTPHAAFGEMEILEIAESSPLDFCLHSWGEEVSDMEFDPSLSLVEALDFINYRRFTAEPGTGDQLVARPQLGIRRIKVNDMLKVAADGYDSFVLYLCTKGSVKIQLEVLGKTIDYPLAAGEIMLLPAECSDFFIEPVEKGSELLEASAQHIQNDNYINPDVEATLPGEE